MGDLWICREQTAQKPFRLETAGAEIRTIEELCFYLYQNIEHLDEEVMDEPLFSWLSEELQLTKLAAMLRQEQGHGRDVLWCTWLLLKEIGMYSDNELEEIRTICFAMENKDEYECRKLKADRLLRNKKYHRSICEYQELLEMEEQERYPRLAGDILHNLGVAHARLFLFPEAAEYFLKAYKRTQHSSSLQAYETALKMQKSAKAAGLIKDTGGSTDPMENTADILDEISSLKEEYRKGAI